MKYTAEITNKKIIQNNDIFKKRQDLYREKGLDFPRSRQFILSKTGTLRGDILDIASGRGIMALALAKAGYSFVSIDRDEDMLMTTALNLAYEKLLHKADLQVMDAYSLEFKEHSFDTVFTVEALHHMEDIDRFFSEINRVLSPSGRLIVADFNRKGMEIISYVHGIEGHEHKTSGLGQEETGTWLESKGYSLKRYENECHWLVIAEK